MNNKNIKKIVYVIFLMCISGFQLLNAAQQNNSESSLVVIQQDSVENEQKYPEEEEQVNNVSSQVKGIISLDDKSTKDDNRTKRLARFRHANQEAQKNYPGND